MCTDIFLFISKYTVNIEPMNPLNEYSPWNNGYVKEINQSR